MTLLIILKNNSAVIPEEEPEIIVDTDNSFLINRFDCIITGSADNLDDITIPISSFQSRRRQSEPTYLSINIPTLDYIESITARANGNIEIYTRGEKIIESDISSVRYDHGSKNQTVTLTGYKTTTFTAKTVNLTGYPVEYKTNTAGVIRYRLKKASTILNPGDTVIIDDDTFTVGLISYFVNTTNQQIEISSV